MAGIARTAVRMAGMQMFQDDWDCWDCSGAGWLGLLRIAGIACSQDGWDC